MRRALPAVVVAAVVAAAAWQRAAGALSEEAWVVRPSGDGADADAHADAQSARSAHACIHDHILASLPAAAAARRPARQLYASDTPADAADAAADADGSVTGGGRRHEVHAPLVLHANVTAPRGRGAVAYSPIRITLDTSRLAANAEPQFACYTAGQQYQPTLAAHSTDRSTCGAADILSAAQLNYLLTTTLPAAVAFFQDMLSVVPVSGNLLLSSPIPDIYCCNNAGSYCNSFVCCAAYAPPGDASPGVPNTDFRLYVTARPTAGSTIAWALTCQSDQIARPVAGHINFNPSRVSLAAADFPGQLSTAVHELMHALGFSGSGFSTWRATGTTAQAWYPNVVWQGAERGNTVKKLITPNVVAAIKAHYNCYTWSNAVAGGEIEDFGAAGTAGSHWEKRVFNNEVMTGTADPNSVYSAMTYAAFADMGWYQVNNAGAQRLPWGNNEGCSFVQDVCSAWPARYFCTVANQGGCTPDMRYRAQCNLMDAPYSLPTQFQYFAGAPGRGGANGYVDYCPVYQRLSNGDCTAAATIGLWFYGETVGAASRCFAGTYQKASLTTPPTQHGGCLTAACSPSNLLVAKLVQTGGALLSVTCPLQGGAVDLSTLPGSEFVGVLNCPPASVMCTGNPCDSNTCSGHGTCSPTDGTCACAAGYYGDTPYDCARRYCPTGVNATGGLSPCAGHATCDTTAGQCKDEYGQPGCFTGWADGPNGTCSRLGCPTRTCNGTAACECAGRGTCVAGACVCAAGYIGSDCGTTDCGVGPNGARCSGAGNGTCDGTRGYCECVDGFDATTAAPVYVTGATCAEVHAGSRVMDRLYFVGEPLPGGGNATAAAAAGVARAKEYTYYVFTVPSTSYPLLLTLALTAGAARNTSVPAAALDANGDGYVAPAERAAGYLPVGAAPLATAPAPPTLVAAYATFGKPTASAAQFTPTTVDAAAYRYTIRLAASATEGGAFTQTGDMLVGVLSTVDAFFTLTLVRDACAVLNCSHGACVNGACVCPRVAEATRYNQYYGWTGELCNVPDCPGYPDCNGGRGVCTVPAAGDAAHADGLPYCACQPMYAGDYCQTYAVASSTRVLGLVGGYADRSDYHIVTAWSVAPDGNVTASQFSLYNATSAGSLDVGRNVTPVLIDPAQLATCCGMAPPLTVYVRLDGTASPLADAMLFGQRNAYASRTSYADFDEAGWRAHAATQEFVTTVPANTLYFVTLYNGRYGVEPLQYSLYVEIVAAGTCPPALRACSGHGVCGATCTCDAGWEGLRCDVPAPTLAPAPGAPAAATVAAAPGAWAYWVVPIPDTPAATRELQLELVVTGPRTAVPLLMAAFASARTATSLALVASEVGMYDYAAYRFAAGRQRLVLRRTSQSAQRYLYVGVVNAARARGVLAANLSVAVAAAASVPACDATHDNDGTVAANATCRALHCHDHGAYVVVNGEPACQCDYGWSGDAWCASPLFASFAHLPAASQSITFLCSVCEVQNVTLDREQTLLFNIPQPLQKATGLRIDVGPQASAPAALAAGRRLLPPPAPADATPARALQVTVGTNTSGAGGSGSGNPSLLVSTSLPRSIIDFFYIASSAGVNETISIEAASPTGNYWVAVYANTPGTFRVYASRYSYAVALPSTPSFLSQLSSWILASTAGYVVLAAGGGLLACVLAGCVLQNCLCCCTKAPPAGSHGGGKGSGGKGGASPVLDEAGELEMRRLRLIRSVRQLTEEAHRVEAAGDAPAGAGAGGYGMGASRRILSAVAASPALSAHDHAALASALATAAHYTAGAEAKAAGGTILRSPSGHVLPAMANPLMARPLPAVSIPPPLVAAPLAPMSVRAPAPVVSQDPLPPVGGPAASAPPATPARPLPPGMPGYTLPGGYGMATPGGGGAPPAFFGHHRGASGGMPLMMAPGGMPMPMPMMSPGMYAPRPGMMMMMPPYAAGGSAQPGYAGGPLRSPGAPPAYAVAPPLR